MGMVGGGTEGGAVRLALRPCRKETARVELIGLVLEVRAEAAASLPHHHGAHTCARFLLADLRIDCHVKQLEEHVVVVEEVQEVQLSTSRQRPDKAEFVPVQQNWVG